MPLAVGTRLGPYEIFAPLGAGGMGEVYRARDTRLKRDVAVKVLPDAFAADAARMARFQREAEVLAALNHPNIAQIYGAEEHALVMELVEGPTLADRIQQGPLPVEEALEIARQIAEALEAAHERGIVHRDLKPANVKVKPDGTVKVLDFGLAAILQTTASGAADPANSPTLTIGATQVGAIMGTAGYMSPEQAVGKPVDRRADIWSFGVVLYEMLTGQRLFTGETASHILADVIKGEIDFSKLPASTPAAIRNLLKRCLDRDVKIRLQWIGEARVAIGNREIEATTAAPSRSRLAKIGNLGWIAAALLAVVAGWGWWRGSQPIERPLVRLDVDLGSDISLPAPDAYGNAVVISPDGTRIAYISGSLYTRRLDQAKGTELGGTQGASSPFFSPDGQWIGFFAGNKLNKISVEGGAVVPLLEIPTAGTNTSWSEDGYIYTTRVGSGVFRFPAAGGTPTNVTELNAGKEFIHGHPQPLPGGKALLFTAYPNPPDPDHASLEVFTFADRRRKVLVPGGIYGRYLPSGHLIYGSKRTLFAVPFDLDKLEIRGTPVPVLDDVAIDFGASGRPQVEVSRNGTLVYRRGAAAASAPMTMQWIDDSGKMQPLHPKPDLYAPHLSLSPDGKRVAYGVVESGSANLWVYDWQGDRSTKLTFGAHRYTSAAWSPDGKYLFLGTLGSGLFWMPSDGSGQPQALLQTRSMQFPWSLAPDGKRSAYYEFDPSGAIGQIWTLPLAREAGQWKAGEPELYLKTKSVEQFPKFSPDGRWLAYTSTESGANEIYVRPFPLPASGGGKWTISTGGGTYPVWSRATHELLYQSGDRVMAVRYTTQGDTFIADKPRVWTEKLGGAQGFDITPDGKRLAAIVPAQSPEASKQEHEVVFLFNFFDELRRRAPVK